MCTEVLFYTDLFLICLPMSPSAFVPPRLMFVMCAKSGCGPDQIEAFAKWRAQVCGALRLLTRQPLLVYSEQTVDSELALWRDLETIHSSVKAFGSLPPPVSVVGAFSVGTTSTHHGTVKFISKSGVNSFCLDAALRKSRMLALGLAFYPHSGPAPPAAASHHTRSDHCRAGKASLSLSTSESEMPSAGRNCPDSLCALPATIQSKPSPKDRKGRPQLAGSRQMATSQGFHPLDLMPQGSVRTPVIPASEGRSSRPAWATQTIPQVKGGKKQEG